MRLLFKMEKDERDAGHYDAVGKQDKSPKSRYARAFCRESFRYYFADGISGDKNVDDAMYKESEEGTSLEILGYKKFFF